VNKKKQKNFDNLDHAGFTATGQMIKVFLVLFVHKKNILLPAYRIHLDVLTVTSPE